MTIHRALLPAAVLALLPAFTRAADAPELWKDPSKPLPPRVKDLMSRMTFDERASQLLADAPAIPHLGIGSYNHRNECLHGAQGPGVSTVFPQAIGMAATWDPALIQLEADTIATEGRARHNDFVAKNN